MYNADNRCHVLLWRRKIANAFSGLRKSPTSTNPHCLTVTNICLRAPDAAWNKDCLADWPSVVMWLCLFTEFGRLISNRRENVSGLSEGEVQQSLPIRKEWPVVLRPPPLVKEVAPIQNTWSERNKNIVVVPDGVRYQGLKDCTGEGWLQFTGLEGSQLWRWGFARQSPASRDMRK
jgi:hypothetical protein